MLKYNFMNKKQIAKCKAIILRDVIERLAKVVDDSSNNKFIDRICRKMKKETGYDVYKNNKEADVYMMCGEILQPLFFKIGEFSLNENYLKSLPNKKIK